MWAAIDIGSNTVQLLVAESEDMRFRPHLFALSTTRLGASAEPGLLEPTRVNDTLAALAKYQALLAREDISGLRVIATSAVRDAANKELLLDAVRQRFGWEIEVLSGAEEARLSFLGAAAEQLATGANHLLLLDIGGSSSELLHWREGNLQALSADLGAVRALSRGWGAAEIAQRLAATLRREDDDSAALAIGAGGTITTAAALTLGCTEFSREAVQGYRLSLAAVEQLLWRLQPLSLAQRCALSPLLERRGEIIYEGLLILRAFLRLLQLPALTVSAGGVLEGCLADLKHQGLSPVNRLGRYGD